MSIGIKALLSAVAVVLAASAANATVNLDQQNSYTNNQFESGSFGQSFTAGISGQLTSIVFQQQTYFNGRNVQWGTISVYSGNTASSANLLGSAAMQATVGNYVSNLSDVTFDLSALNVFLTAGSQYTFQATGSNQAYTLLFDEYNHYASGDMLLNGNTFTGKDTKFATYVNGEPNAVPEPEIWLTMIVGFGMLGTALRSRGRTTASFG